MALTQQTFLGASIRNFSASIGWGNQSSTLEVGLVEDPVNGDSIDAPVVGSPVYFDYQGWKFGGLLQSIVKQSGQEGNSVYQVQIQDPRELLAGVQLILQGYNGSTYGIPNIYNIYGWKEATYGFGTSQVNDTGMPWTIVRDGFRVLQATQPMIFRGESFYFAPFVDELLLSTNYRVGGDSISVLDFVEDICSALAYDYFIDMTRKNGANWIELHVVGRNTQLREDAINTFISGVTGAVSKEQGYELRNETTSKFVVGGRVCELYFQPQLYWEDNSQNIMYNDTIMPYWGHDCYNRLILMNNDGSFMLDGRAIAKQTYNEWLTSYTTNVWEMRAILEGQDAWEAFIWAESHNPNSIHRHKAALLGISEGFSGLINDYLSTAATVGPLALPVVRPISMLNLEKAAIENGFRGADAQDSFCTNVFQWLSVYANDYYGKKFMVRVPFLLTKLVPESNTIVLSLEPTDGGFLSANQIGQAVYDGLMPSEIDQFTLDDNRIEGYVRFASTRQISFYPDDPISYITQYTTDGLTQDDFILDQYAGANSREGFLRENLFVRCSVDPIPVFLDKNTLFSPRMIVTIPDMVSYSEGVYSRNNLLTNMIINRLVAPGGAWNIAQATALADSLQGVFGAELLWFGTRSAAAVPDLAVLPLQSNILQYGPWFSAECAGKVEYEHDDTLVPWNYGGYDLMNLVGRSKVQGAQASQLTSERGTIEFPGTPDVQLGQALLDSGPAVTDISVSIAAGGITTTYRMSTWSYEYGRIGKYNMERLLRIQKLAQEQRKAFRQLFKKPTTKIHEISKSPAAIAWARRNSKNSSANLLAGNVLISGEGDDLRVVTNVAAIAGYRLLSQINPDTYPTQAGMSLDGMFVPYTTNPSTTYTSYMPHFDIPTATAQFPTVDDLNPFGENPGIALTFPESNNLPNNLGTEMADAPYTGSVKGIGLKAPVIIGGWGYDTKDKPVPIGTEPDSFADNYKTRADLWKVGPLDIKWDDNRKVWTFPPGSSITEIIDDGDTLINSSTTYLGKVYNTIQPMSSGLADRYSHQWVNTYGALDGVFNPLDQELQTGLRIYYRKYKGWTGLIALPIETMPPRLGVVYSTIAKNSYGRVHKTVYDWSVDPSLGYDDVYNPHNIELPTGLRVKYTTYNNWGNRYIVEPFDYTACSGVEDQGYNQ